jgi:hypothetical protein
MQGKQQRQCDEVTERPGVERGVAAVSGLPTLPTWESFREEDRRRLVQAILHAARRQVERLDPVDSLRRK